MPRGGPRPMGPRMVQQQQGMGFDRQAMAMMNRPSMGLPNQGMVARPQQYKYTQVCMMPLHLDCSTRYYCSGGSQLDANPGKAGARNLAGKHPARQRRRAWAGET